MQNIFGCHFKKIFSFSLVPPRTNSLRLRRRVLKSRPPSGWAGNCNFPTVSSWTFSIDRGVLKVTHVSLNFAKMWGLQSQILHFWTKNFQQKKTFRQFSDSPKFRWGSCLPFPLRRRQMAMLFTIGGLDSSCGWAADARRGCTVALGLLDEAWSCSAAQLKCISCLLDD